MKNRQRQCCHINGESVQPKTICYVGAHSGGHITPCLTMAEREYTAHQSSILFFTSTKLLDVSLLQKASFPVMHRTVPIPQKRTGIYALLFPIFILLSFLQSFFDLLATMPEKIVTTGGITAVPVCVAGWLLGIPIELFELNAQPGKAIRFLAPFATTIRHCFTTIAHHFPHTQCLLTPYPIRFEQPTKPFTHPSFSPDRLTLFVLGGSQGSHGINNFMHALIMALDEPIQVIHQTGRDIESIKAWYVAKNIPAHVFAYDHTLAQYYVAADLIICRAGAGALFEAAHFQKPCLTLPLVGLGDDHQRYNAEYMQKEFPSLFSIASTQESSSLFIKNQVKKRAFAE